MSEKCDSNYTVRHKALDTADRVLKAFDTGRDAQSENAQAALNQWHKEYNEYRTSTPEKCIGVKNSKTSQDFGFVRDSKILPTLLIGEVSNIVKQFGHKSESANGKTMTWNEIQNIAGQKSKNGDGLTGVLVGDAWGYVTKSGSNETVSEGSLSKDLKVAKEKFWREK